MPSFDILWWSYPAAITLIDGSRLTILFRKDPLSELLGFRLLWAYDLIAKVAKVAKIVINVRKFEFTARVLTIFLRNMFL